MVVTNINNETASDVLVIIIDVMLFTCTPPTSVVKVVGFNFSYSYYALVGGAMGHTVVCTFVCL